MGDKIQLSKVDDQTVPDAADVAEGKAYGAAETLGPAEEKRLVHKIDLQYVLGQNMTSIHKLMMPASCRF